ncbi:MAG: PAS domain S-box protein, partial [Planctomycetaceae bacterium]
MSFGEQHPLQRRQPRIAKEQASLRLSGRQIQLIRRRRRAGFSRTASQEAQLGPLGVHVQTLVGQPVDQLLKQHQDPLERIEAGNAPPVRSPAGCRRAVDPQWGEVIVGWQPAPGLAFAEKRVLERPVPGRTRKQGCGQGESVEWIIRRRAEVTGDRFPSLAIQGKPHFDVKRDPIAKLPQPVAGDPHARDPGGFGQLELHPFDPRRGRNPTPVVAIPAVVQVGDRVYGIAGDDRRRGGQRPALGEPQVQLRVRTEQLEFVDARLAAAAPMNDQPDKPGCRGQKHDATLRRPGFGPGELRLDFSFDDDAWSRVNRLEVERPQPQEDQESQPIQAGPHGCLNEPLRRSIQAANVAPRRRERSIEARIAGRLPRRFGSPPCRCPPLPRTTPCGILSVVMPEYLSATPLQLLLVDSDPDFAARLRDLGVESARPGLVLTWTTDTAEAVMLSQTRAFDVLLLGADATSRPSLTAFAQLHKSAPNLPIILLTSADDDDTSLLAVREGAEDHLVKGGFDRRELLRVLRHAIERKRIESRLRRSEEFFRLISENVTDLIAVVDRDGRRLYNNPAYERSLGPSSGLAGTDSFHEIHPEDRARIQAVFRETLAS